MIADMTDPAEMSPAGQASLDDTVIRRLDAITESLNKKPSFPPWVLPLVMYLVGQLVGGVWWAAMMQSDVRYIQRENVKLWQKVETHDLQMGRLDTIVRNAVKEAMQDSDYVRIPKKGE